MTLEGLVRIHILKILLLRKKGTVELFTAMFGQMPYFITPDGIKSLTEVFNEDLWSGISMECVYKNDSPIPSVGGAAFHPTDDTLTVYYPEKKLLIEMPEGMIQEPGPWYTLVPADINLSEFPVPEVGGDPVVLTGVEMPQQSEVAVFHTNMVQEYHWRGYEVGGFYYFIDGDRHIEYTIFKETADGDWMWEAVIHEG